MYQKVRKSVECPFGIKRIYDIDLDKPFVFFSTSLADTKNNNGFLNRTLDFLGFYNKNDINLGLDIENVPFNIYAEGFLIDEKIIKEIEKRLKNSSFEELSRLFRNFNFVSFCLGNENLYEFLVKLRKMLLKNNLTEEEVNTLMSKITVTQIVDNSKLNTIPGLIVNTIHIIQDKENPSFNDIEINPNEGEFSRVMQEKRTPSNNLILVDTFGEGSLRDRFEHREHSFSLDYARFPVINSLISVIINTALYSSLNNTSIDIDSFQEGIRFVLHEAYLYEKKLNKDLNLLTKEELAEFNIFIYNKVMDYLKKKYNLEPPSIEEIELHRIDDEYLRNNRVMYSGEFHGDIIDDLRKLQGQYYEIFRFKDKDPNEIVEYLSDLGNIKVKVKEPVCKFVDSQYEKLKTIGVTIIDKINKIEIPDNISIILKQEIVNWKKEKYQSIKDIIFDERLKEYLQRNGIFFESELPELKKI